MMKNQCNICHNSTFDCDCSDDEIEQKPKLVYNLKDINPQNKQLLADIRIISKSLIYVIGLSPTIANEQVFIKQSSSSANKKTDRDPEQYVQPTESCCVHHVQVRDGSLSCNTSNFSAYICMACESFHLLDRIVKASFGTTKYCTNFLKGSQCKIKDCVYLHNHPKDRENTEVLKKDEMNNSKWLFTYSQKIARANFGKCYGQVQIKNVPNGVFPSVDEIFDKMYEMGIIEKEIQQKDEWDTFNGYQQQIDHKGLAQRLEDVVRKMQTDNSSNSRFKFIQEQNSNTNNEAIVELKQYVTK